MYSLQLEMGILSSILDNLSLANGVSVIDFYFPITKYVMSILSTTSFTVPNASIEYIYSALQSTPHTGLTDLQIEQITVSLRNTKPSVSFNKDVEQLKKFTHMRTLKTALVTSDELLKDGDFTKARDSVFSTIVKLGEDEASSLTAALSQSIEELFPNDSMGFVPSGYDLIDNTFGGFGAQELITLAADSSSGKSTLMQIMALKSIPSGYNPVYFNLEMSKKSWFSRYFSYIGQVSLKDITLNFNGLARESLDRIYNGLIDTYTTDDISANKLKEVYNSKKPGLRNVQQFFIEAKKVVNIRKNDIIIISDGINTVGDIFQKTNALLKNRRCDIVYVDYINMLLTTANKMSVAEKLAQLALELKNLAKSLNIPVVMAAQWNSNENDVKYAKAIRETSDTVLHWVEYFPGTKKQPGFSVYGPRYFAFGSTKSRNGEPIPPKIMETDFSKMAIDITTSSLPEGALSR